MGGGGGGVQILQGVCFQHSAWFFVNFPKKLNYLVSEWVRAQPLNCWFPAYKQLTGKLDFQY